MLVAFADRSFKPSGDISS